MAYGLRFQDDFFDVDEHKWRLKIYKKDYTESTEVNTLVLGPDPVKITWEQKDGDFFSPIIGSSCKIQMYVTEDSGGTFWQNENTNWESADFSWEESSFDFVQPINDREYKIELCYASSHDGSDYVYTSYWTGFIIQDQYSLPLKPFPYLIEFFASDLIGTIDGYSYSGTTERPSCIEVIKECLKNINEQNASGDTNAGLQFNYQTLCRIRPNTSTTDGDPFLQSFIRSKEAMNDENDIPINCKTILESTLQMFNCRIFQRNSKWVIISNDAMALDEFNGTGKVFIDYNYDDVSSSTGITSISTPTKNINSTEANDTIQPLGNDLVKILKRPCVRALTNVRVKDMLLNEISNGTFEIVSSPSGNTPSWGYNINNWTVTNGATTSNTEYAVDVDSKDTSIWPNIIYGIEPASGEYSVISIGRETDQQAFNTEVLKSATGNIGTVGGNVVFKFSNYAYDPDRPASDPLLYSIRYQFKVGNMYWDNNNQEWTSSAQNGKNTITGSVAQQWTENTVTMPQPPAAGNLEIIFYKSGEDAYENNNFRMYFDNVIVIPQSSKEFFSTRVVVTKSPFDDNSGVLKTFNNRFGQIGDIIYSNTLVNSSGTAISSYKYFATDVPGGDKVLLTEMPLETMMNVLRLNDLAESNDMFEGTFRKVNTTSINPSGARVNSLEPIDMLTKPKMNFTSISGLDNELAIDRLDFNVSKNRYNLVTHTPQNILNNAPIQNTTEINYNRNFYEFKPEE